MDETIDGDATLEMEREWESMERDAMECHDSARSLRHENAMLEIAFMAKEDQLSQEYQESRYYEQFDQEYEATAHPETTTADTPVGPTSPSDAAPAEVPDEAASSTRPRSPPSTTGTAPWDAYWDHFPRPFGDAPWHQPEPAAASSSTSLGATPKPKASKCTKSTKCAKGDRLESQDGLLHGSVWGPVLGPFGAVGPRPITKSPGTHWQPNFLEGESQQMVPVVAKPGLGWHRTTPSVVSWLSFSICFHKGLKSPKFNQDHWISLFFSGGRETTIGEALWTSTDKPFLSMGMIPMLQIGPDHESPATETARAQPKRKMLPNTQLSHQVKPCMAMQPQWHYSLSGITALHGLSYTLYSMVIHPYM